MSVDAIARSCMDAGSVTTHGPIRTPTTNLRSLTGPGPARLCGELSNGRLKLMVDQRTNPTQAGEPKIAATRLNLTEPPG